MSIPDMIVHPREVNLGPSTAETAAYQSGNEEAKENLELETFL
jgi:hypothetical protein